MRRVAVLGAELKIVNLMFDNDILVLVFNNSFIGVDYLLKFLEVYKTNFNIKSFVFGVVGEHTKVSITIDGAFTFDGLFVKKFLGELNGFEKN